MEDINRLKLLLVEKKKTSKWLSEQLGITPSTVSKWCTNTSQPDMETLARISKLLNVGVEDLYNQQFMESVKYYI
jgi:transcriptional regulator with XRE-family HTH domain